MTLTSVLPQSTGRLVADCAAVLHALYPASSGVKMPALVLVGHSMGGAIAARAAAPPPTGSFARGAVAGCCVVDVVEGTALAALPSMAAVLQGRPARFKSRDAAVRWTVNSGMVRNLESARISVPPQLRPVSQDPNDGFAWRTDLQATEPYWKGNPARGSVGGIVS
jgi:pimeloyl-ACP methyl ester carboxylesterase